MSMPSFPPCGADMTKDEAITMIIASIAMEELALSHIVNAEGEKLQYVLGTLPDSPKVCASPQEILAVNKSVKELLDTVMQNQMLLKGKLEKALDAGGHAPAPTPPCPCEPSVPPCCGECGRKSAIQLVSQCDHFSWGNRFCDSHALRRLFRRSAAAFFAEVPILRAHDPALFRHAFPSGLPGRLCRSLPAAG